MCLVWHNRSCDTAGIEEPAIVLNVSRSSTRQMTSSTAPSAIDASAHANTEYSERIFADMRRGFAKRRTFWFCKEDFSKEQYQIARLVS